ncbi:MAG: alkaline phosphatase family protein [Thaumarchaeota archaeon]|nr:alkaline phosphatase family protein [Nitrososphaerota archaeon]
MGFINPKYNGESIINIYDSVLSFFGGSGKRPLRNDLGTGRKLLLIIIDALGVSTLEHAFPEVVEYYEKNTITSVFPSTTAAAMLSFYTGMAPGEHGVLGFTSYIKELGTIVNMLSLSHPSQREQLPLLKHDFRSYLGNNSSPIGERLQEIGVKSKAILPISLIGTPISTYTTSGMIRIPYHTNWDAMSLLKKELASNNGIYITLYISTVDTLSHIYGPYSEEVKNATKDILKAINKTLSETRGFTAIITADHGQSYNEITHICDQELFSMLEMPPFGDARAVYMKTYNEEKVIKYFENKFPKFKIYYKKEAIEQHLFGDNFNFDRFSDRIGDLIAIPESNESLVYQFKGNLDTEYISLKGHHGGLTTEEQEVPLLIMRK